MWRALICCMLLAAITACQAGPIGKQFFKDGFVAREERLEAYPLEQQWQIFLYANQVIHPPLTGMALPIAKQGKPALDYILQQLEKSVNEADFRDSLVVFQTMQWGNYYNVCSDTPAMAAIRRNENKISHPGWRDIYRQMLEALCREWKREVGLGEPGSKHSFR